MRYDNIGSRHNLILIIGAMAMWINKYYFNMIYFSYSTFQHLFYTILIDSLELVT